jgi:uncharacterized protein YcfJ
MNKPSKIIASLLCLGAAQCASAADFDDTARVLNVMPRVEQFNQPQQECRTEYVPVQQQGRGVGGSIIGGVAGALLGSQVGGGNGRTAAAAVGAITGAVVGDRMENNNAYAGAQQQAVQQCHMVDHWETRTSGYSVNYEYRGHSYTSVMPYDPGERLKVRVSVTPLQQQDQRLQHDLRQEQRQQWQQQ